MLISIKTLLSGITQEIHIRVQDVSIDIYIGKFDFFSQNGKFKWKKTSTLFLKQKYRKYLQFNGSHATCFEVSTFKLILKFIIANYFLWHMHSTRF